MALALAGRPRPAPAADAGTEAVSDAPAATALDTPSDTRETPGTSPLAGASSESGPSVAKQAPGSPFVRSEPHPAPPFPILLNNAVKGYVKDFLDQPGGLKLAFQRSRPFMFEMMNVMESQGIPDDLVYLTFAESGFSDRGKGPWQFNAGTAKRFGLRVNPWVDDRRDPIQSTRAAAEYLAALHDQADNDWRVAVIGWNMGEGNLARYWLLEGSTFNKFENRLPRRTRALLSRFMAVAFIAQNAAAYGIGPVNFSEGPGYQLRKFKGGTGLGEIARRFGTSVKTLHSLNPALLTDLVPPYAKSYGIRVPLRLHHNSSGSF